jgi:hypothetical protein
MVGHSKPVNAADRRSGPLGAAVHGVLAVIAVSAVIVLTACGNRAGGTGRPRRKQATPQRYCRRGASAGVPLWRPPSKLTGSWPASPRAACEILPRGIRNHGRAPVRALAAAPARSAHVAGAELPG